MTRDKMKTLSQLLLALVLCSACPSTSFGQAVQTQRSSITDAELDARVNDYVQPYVQMNDFSGVVFIEKQNKIRVNRSYGSSNYELNAPIDSRTKFRIASISKQLWDR